MASRFPDVSTVCVLSAVILSCVNFVSSAPFVALVDSILVSWAEDLIQGLNYTHSPFVGGATCRECSFRLNRSSPQVSLIITFFLTHRLHLNTFSLLSHQTRYHAECYVFAVLIFHMPGVLSSDWFLSGHNHSSCFRVTTIPSLQLQLGLARLALSCVTGLETCFCMFPSLYLWSISNFSWCSQVLALFLYFSVLSCFILLYRLFS